MVHRPGMCFRAVYVSEPTAIKIYWTYDRKFDLVIFIITFFFFVAMSPAPEAILMLFNTEVLSSIQFVA